MQLGGLDLKLVEQVFAINAVGPIRVTQAVLSRDLLKMPGGKVAHISSKLGSIASNTATGGIYAYRMSKSALNAAGKSMAVDLKARGVAVALLVPGYVATPMNGDKGDVTAEASARGLYARIVDDLSLTNSGTFFGTDGAPVPW
jgi:NAD(P)-dependent dehydrogenase (short-subunit alcohol dehydrogenase family)